MPKKLLLMISMLFVSACSIAQPGQEPPKPPKPPISGKVICEALGSLWPPHAEALAKTQDEAVLMTGAALIDTIDAGCAG